jgi:hypothetical protein
MNMRPMIMVNSMLIAAMSVASVWAWSALPDGLRVPDGTPAGFVDKAEIVFGLPLFALAATVFVWLVPRIYPRRPLLEAGTKFFNACGIMLVAFMACWQGAAIWIATGHSLDLRDALAPSMGLMLIGLGNYVSKTHPANWSGLMGLLLSDDVKAQTLRWFGRMLVASGLATVIAWLGVNAQTAMHVSLIAMALTMLASLVVSCVFERRHRAAAKTNSEPQG